MVKAYLRYELSSTFGVVTSNSALVQDITGKLVVTAALENVAVWNLRQGTLVNHIPICYFFYPFQSHPDINFYNGSHY